ncbi:MAG: family transcriptional regulator [Modestobacter sp.]|nr:family transcriptional regulator [Modestobacter sp.]MCW2578350.1 family transcriptional regulator [Modestobacter sp.]
MGSLWTEVALLIDDQSLAPNAHAARSVIARLIADSPQLSRAEIVKATGLARSTIDKHLGVLMDAGLVEDAGLGRQDARGRPAQVFRISAKRGVLLVADVGATASHLAITTLDKVVVARAEVDIDVAVGPEKLLEAVCEAFMELLAQNSLGNPDVLGISIGLPGPVDSKLGMVVRPPLMPGWDGFLVCRFMASYFHADVVVDNNVNLMALGEARTYYGKHLPLLMIYIDTGIGAGFVGEDGRVLHGADGSAADIGHVQLQDSDALCRCGNRGCLEAVASVGAIASRLSTTVAHEVAPEDLLTSLARGEAAAVSVVRETAARLGCVIANLVNFCNPARIVVGGPIAEASEDVLAQVRSVVYQQAQPLATRNLSLVHSALGDEAGLVGGMVSAIEQVLSPRGIAYHSRGPGSDMQPLGL